MKSSGESALLLGCLLSLLLAGTTRPNSSMRPDKTANNPRRAVTVLISHGSPLGSGVVVRQSSQGFWIITNRHVLVGIKVACIETADGLQRPGIPLPNQVPDRDLSFLWVPATDHPPISAKLSDVPPEIMARNHSVVIATGFPTPTEVNTEKPAYTEREGLLLPLLTEPIEDGYHLTYTSQVTKGMSGGGIFNERNQLIGINATHPEPLWDAQWHDIFGNPLNKDLNRRLALVALGISWSQFRGQLEKLRPSTPHPKPSTHQICKKDQETSS